MIDRTPILLPEIAPDSGLRKDAIPALGVASLIAYPFPPGEPVGALVAVWCRQGRRKELAGLIPILRLLGEITGAALGCVCLLRADELMYEQKCKHVADT